MVAPSAGVSGTLRPSFGLALSYAHEPLVLRQSGGEGDGQSVRRVVAHQLVPRALASLAFLERALVFVEVPFVAYQSGDPSDPTLADGSFPEPEATVSQDLPLGGRIELLDQHDHFPGIALGATAYLPVGDAHNYGGAGSARFEPRATISADHQVALWTLGVSRLFEVDAPPQGNLLGDEIRISTAAAARIAPLMIGAELDLGIGVGEPASHARRPVRGELLASGRLDFGPVGIALAAGPGLSPAPGTPTFRVLSGVSVTFDALPPHSEPSEQPGADPDTRDGSALARPATETTPAHAPKDDRDGDEVLDPADLCPDVPGPKQGKRPGCPPDADGDRIADVDDACPAIAGTAHPSPEKHGCPLDTDGDGLPDTEDPCPKEPGPTTNDRPAGERGCPKTIRIEEGRLLLLAPIQFATGKATLLPESNAILDEVRDALERDPTIVRIAVDGHTDNRGFPGANLDLSRARAVTVVRYLTERGVDTRRIEARGFGQKQPVADNKNDAGRAKNRRVEFIVLRRDARGKAAWVDGNLQPAAATGPKP